MATTPAIAVDRLVKIYRKVPAVDGVSFSIAPGSITGLLGGNGAGKSTTIAMIMGLIMPTAGSVRVLGAEMPAQRYRVLHRMNFESPYVEMPMRLTIRQNLKVFGMLYGVADIAGRIEQLAEALDLTASARPADRQTFGRAKNPGLARQGADQFARTAAARRAYRLARSRYRRLGAGAAGSYCRERGATVLLASHNMAEVERLCERVIIMKLGRIEDDDTPARLLSRYGRRTLEEVFLDVARRPRGSARGRAMSMRIPKARLRFRRAASRR